MKLAILSDVHGNAHALSAVLEDVAGEAPDKVLGAGDMVGCSVYPGGPQVLEMLRDAGVEWVRGNEEERLVGLTRPDGGDIFKYSVQFLPLRYRAGQFTERDMAELAALPVRLHVPGPYGEDVLVCHASPYDLFHTPYLGIDASMEADLARVAENVIALGHYHLPWHRTWRDKLLVMAGSAGLPLRGKKDEVDYLILEAHRDGWQFRYKAVPYDGQAALRAALESDFLAKAGPIGWMMLAESVTQLDHLSPFFAHACPAQKPESFEGWKQVVLDYLSGMGHWDEVHALLQPWLG